MKLGSLLMSLASLGFFAYAIIFFVGNFTEGFFELGIGAHEVDKTKAEIIAFSQSLFNYISHLHVAGAAFIASTGLSLFFLSWFGVRQGIKWAYWGAVMSGILGLTVSLPLHYVYGLDSIEHLGILYLATIIFVVGALISLKGIYSKI